MDQINECFRDLASSHTDKFLSSISFLSDEMKKRNCKFGDEIVPAFIKPVFLPQSYFTDLENILDHIVSILEKTAALYFSHPELKSFFCLNKQEEELMTYDHGYSKNIVITRPDAFFMNNIIRFVEFNCDSPAGPGYADITEDIMKESFPIQTMSSLYSLRPHDRMGHLLNALLTAYKEFSGTDNKPNIAIIDWREVRTQNEFMLLKDFFEKKGYQTIICDPRDLEYQNGQLAYQGTTIDLVYRRVIFRELMSRFDEVQNFIQAFKDRAVCVVNPFRSRLASSKAILSIITNPKKFRHHYTKEEQNVIHRHIPWTRRVLDIKTQFNGNSVFIKKHIIAHKNQLVLKPSDSYGGKNVMIGCECPQNEWEALVYHILDNEEDWVVQRYVPISQIEVPVAKNNKVYFENKKYNINPFIFGGHYAGSMSRLSDKSVINVSAGGGMVPVIEYNKLNPTT